ncbi:hypothetical protein SELMODRAFT_420212 [Selaginella moellendorffii]|uniref:Protein kinase domain-containing protein n=1 Tax=Selaginella moellendorffii TaxID=88036 RepID=D8SBA7_SELML|nr:hypothetical protein SELMODRAFT_420212 [Selaginella moellendorffii]
MCPPEIIRQPGLSFVPGHENDGYSNYDYGIESREVECGAGSYGSVRLDVYREQAVAVTSNNHGVSESSIQREIEVMRSLKSEFRVPRPRPKGLEKIFDRMPFKDALKEQDLTFEFTLRFLASVNSEDGSELSRHGDCQGFMWQSFSLHGRGIAHEDVKSDALNFGMRANMCDFGTARLSIRDTITSSQVMRCTWCGTRIGAMLIRSFFKVALQERKLNNKLRIYVSTYWIE